MTGWDHALLTTKVLIFFAIRALTMVAIFVAAGFMSILSVLLAPDVFTGFPLVLGLSVLFSMLSSGFVGRDLLVYMVFAKMLFSEKDVKDLDESIAESEKDG